MEEQQQEDKHNEYYRGMDLMEPQRKLIFQKLKETIKQEQGELAYLLDCLEKNHETHHQYIKEIEQLQTHTGDVNKIQELQEKSSIIDTTQDAILLAMQPLFNQVYDQIGEEIPPGMGYNEELRHVTRFNLIFGEKELSNTMEHFREHYRVESAFGSRQETYEKKLQKRIAKSKAEKEKVRLPKEHILITKENYEISGNKIAKYMEDILKQYGTIFSLNTKNKEVSKQLIEKYFLYLFIKALIDMKCVFDIKSTKGGKCLDGSIECIIRYFEKSLGQKLEIDPKSVRRRLWSNIHSDETPMDLSYKNALLEDVEYREKYLDTTYFKNKGTSLDAIRIEIMKEYNAQKGIREKTLEMLNPLYHIYKDQVNKHMKHLEIIQNYQKKSSDQDSRVADIIKDINDNLAYAQEKKKEHTIFEENIPKTQPKYDHSLTEIQNRYMKRYQVPIQYRHVFGIVVNKINNFFQYKIGLIKKVDKVNSQLFENILHSEQNTADVIYFFDNYIMNKDLDKLFDDKRETKRSDRIINLANTIQKTQKPTQNYGPTNDAQLSLNF